MSAFKKYHISRIKIAVHLVLRLGLRVCVCCRSGWRACVVTEGALHSLIDRQKMHMKKTLEQNEVITVD